MEATRDWATHGWDRGAHHQIVPQWHVAELGKASNASLGRWRERQGSLSPGLAALCPWVAVVLPECPHAAVLGPVCSLPGNTGQVVYGRRAGRR